MKSLGQQQLDRFFSALTANYRVLLPILLPDGTRALGQPTAGPLALHGGALPGKPTAPFFPQQEAMFTACSGVFQSPPLPSQPLLVAGFTARDLDCLRFIDRFFAEGWRDDLYFRRRQGAVVVAVTGLCGPGGALLPLAGGNCDLEMVFSGERWLLIPYSPAGEALIADLEPGDHPEILAELQGEGEKLARGEEELMRRAAELLRKGRVPDSFWEEIGDRCIACTGCNLACPTCTCFGVQDWRYREKTERSRMWDSCQLDGFMREASGHNPLGTEALRTRRRIHHKLAADLERWGEISCFLCGRCDAVCPTGIGIVAVAGEMVARFTGR
jgi:formate hydrogenlyase subunit 6/NADH:ubiquinone oxidoreductase subunit I